MTNFLQPKVNINRYKAFPQWTAHLTKVKLGDKQQVPTLIPDITSTAI